MAKPPTYDRLTIERYAQKLLARAKLVTLYGFIGGGVLGGGIAAASGFAFRFVTSVRPVLKGLSLGLNTEQATDAANGMALVCGAAGGLTCGIAGAFLGAGAAARYGLAAQQALCQLEIERHLSKLVAKGAEEQERPPTAG
jgi:hypothetical protein